MHDSQEAHFKALLLDMNVLYSMEEAIGCALDKQNQELFSLSNQAIGFSEHNKMATRQAERICQEKINRTRNKPTRIKCAKIRHFC